MFDKGFEEPNYDIGGGYGDSNYNGNYDQGPDKKKIIKFAIIGIVILAVIIFVFITLTAQQTITFNITQLDGGVVEENFRILNSNNESVYQGRGSTHIVTLAPGEYTYTVQSLNYKTITRPLTVGSEKIDPISIKLEKDISAELIIKEISGEKIYWGQKITGILKVENEGTSAISKIRILTDNTFFNIKLTPSEVSISPQKDGTIIFEIEIKETNKVTTSKDEKIEFRLAGTNSKTSVTLKTMKSVAVKEVKITASGIRSGSLIDEKLIAGQGKKPNTITIKNENKTVDMENVLVEIVAESGKEDKLYWLDFLGNDAGEPRKITINKIEAGKAATLVLNINPAINEEVGAQFRGEIKVSSLSIDDDAKVGLLLTVSEKLEPNLVLDGLSYSTKCKIEEGCDEIDTSLGKTKLENKSKYLDITNIKLSLIEDSPSDPDCLYWITLTQTDIPLIKAGEEANVVWKIEPDETASKEFNSCFLKWTYDDPINIGERAQDQAEVKIRVTVND